MTGVSLQYFRRTQGLLTFNPCRARSKVDGGCLLIGVTRAATPFLVLARDGGGRTNVTYGS